MLRAQINHETVPVRYVCVTWVFYSSTWLRWRIQQPLVVFFDHQVCHVRPRFQKAGKAYPTCGLTCAAVLANSPSSPRGSAPKLNPLSEQFRKLSLPNHDLGHVGNHPSPQHSPREKGRNSRHHSSQVNGNSRSLRGSTETQTTVTTGHLGQVYQPCVVCFLSNPSWLNSCFWHSIT